jgi:tRNA (guanine6-N2)-methyltransferase
VPLAGSPGDEVCLASLRRSVRSGVLSALKTPGGTGTLLVAAGRLEPELILLGSDPDLDAIDLTRTNFDRFGVTGRLDIAMAERIQQPDRSVDRVVANGKLVGSHAGNGHLYPAALEEIARVLADDGRVVLMTDDKRLFKNAVMHTTGLKIVRERVLRYGGMTPTVFVLGSTRRRPDRGSGPLPGAEVLT